MNAHYAELHCLSCFSFQRGASHAHELMRRARRLGYAALAITDECSLAGIVRAHEAAKNEGIKLIVGTEIRIEDGPRLVLLAPDKAGYEAISTLITQARHDSPKGEYRLLRENVRTCGTSCLALWLPETVIDADHASWVHDTFPGSAWIAVELHQGPRDAARLKRLREAGMRCGLPLVAAGDVHYHIRKRRLLQDALTSIRHGIPVSECGQRLFPNGERHLRIPARLRSIYPADLIQQTLQVAERCTFRLDELRYEYPKEVVGAGHTPSTWLRHLTYEGVRRRWPLGASESVLAQIEKELLIIADKQYEAFFLTVFEIVQFARQQKILCQGRGSAANSAVCYALGITEVDPARRSTLFERFISRERNEPPDIDVDFEHQRREEVIQHIYNTYGRTRAAIAATVIHYRPRMAIRDAGKVLGVAADQIDALGKNMAWWDRRHMLPQRLRELGLDPDTPLLRRWLRLVKLLVGMPRHLSQHVGGFIISDQPVSHLVPIQNAAMPDRTIIQWDKDDLEYMGLLKVDVLALGMLSALRRTLKMLSDRRGQEFALHDIPQEDAPTYAMIQRGETVGVFQIESRAQMSMLPRLKPQTFYDLVVEVAIVRPGPIQGAMVHPYLKRRRDRDAGKPLDCPPGLMKALARTLGIPLFQEQVMQIAIDAAGFDPGEADQVRRSMAAWKRHGGLEHFRQRLIGGMLANGYEADFAERIYKMILGFGSYGFPESHAVSFALLAYFSAWLKCHEPAAFFAGLINSQPMGFYAPMQLVQEAQRAGVEVRAVDVTSSDWDCTLEPGPLPQPMLRLGLRVVKNLPEAAAQRLQAARAQAPFADFDDLVHRARLGARERNALADADALRALTGHRHLARWAALGAGRLPGMLAGHAAKEPQLDLLPTPPEAHDIVADYAHTGLTLRRHPVALLRDRLDALKVSRATDLGKLPGGRQVRVAGLVINRQRPQTAKGTVFMTLEDETGSHNLIVWSAVLEEHRLAALGASFLIVSGELQKAQGVTHIVVRRFYDRSTWIGQLQTASRDFH